MGTAEPGAPVHVGDPAPDFTLPAVQSERSISLGDYRGKSPVFLAIDRGLYCPFCRRHIAQLGATSEKLRAVGVETLAVIATKPDRARMYLRFRPTRVPLVADPDRVTHRQYGLAKPPITPEFIQAAEATLVNPTGELPAPVPVLAVIDALNQFDSFQPNETDRQDQESQTPQLVGQFLIDTDGLVRWANIECSVEGLAGVGKFPTDDELIAAARRL